MVTKKTTNKSASTNALTPNPKEAASEKSRAKKSIAPEAEPVAGKEKMNPKKSLKVKKKHGHKVVRDRFAFPEQDYLKISQIKTICLAEGLRVKKSEVLRAGVDLLSQLDPCALKEAIGKVERLKTGRPVSEKG